MKKIFITIALLLFLLIHSCKQEEIINYEDVNFLNDIEPSGADLLNMIAVVDTISNPPVQADFILFWIGRRSLEEREGYECPFIGFCKWGWQTYKDGGGFNPSPVDRQVVLPICKDSSDNIYPIELHLTSDPSGISSSDLQFIITQPMVFIPDSLSNITFDELIVFPGLIPFDSTIGDYGGYTLTITGINY